MAFDPYDPNHPNADLEFEFGFEPARDEIEVLAEEVALNVETSSRKTTGKPSPYEKREVIVQKQSESGKFQPVVVSSQSVGIHAAKPQGFFKTAVDKMFRTKKVSGVIAIGAESVTVVKTFKPEEFRVGLQDYVDADED